jgi:hypothetical protein
MIVSLELEIPDAVLTGTPEDFCGLVFRSCFKHVNEDVLPRFIELQNEVKAKIIIDKALR